MAAAAPSIASPFIALGVIACIGALGAVICAVCCCCAAAKERGGGGGAFSTGVKHEGLLDKSKDSAAAVGLRRLRPCGHVYHADCIGLWLQRRWTCPVCRADVLLSPTEIMDAMV